MCMPVRLCAQVVVPLAQHLTLEQRPNYVFKSIFELWGKQCGFYITLLSAIFIVVWYPFTKVWTSNRMHMRSLFESGKSFSKISKIFFCMYHYSDLIMSTVASQIISVWSVYSTVCSGPDQRKHQSSASLAFVRRIHMWPVNCPH